MASLLELKGFRELTPSSRSGKITVMPVSNRVVYPVKSPKVRQKRLLSRKGWLPFSVVVLLAAGVGGFIYIMNLSQLRLKNIEVRGAALLSSDDIQKEVRNETSGWALYVFPKDNFLIISSSKIEQDLRRRFPQASGIAVSRKFPATLAVSVSERIFWGVYCEAGGTRSPTGPCFYIDTRGVAYDRLSGWRGLLIPVIYSPAGATLGSVAVDTAVLEFFGKAKQSLAAINADLLSVAWSTSTPADIRLNVDEGWYALVTSSRPVEEWLGVLKTLLEKEVGDKRGQLDYVDLRFGNKVFYKFK